MTSQAKTEELEARAESDFNQVKGKFFAVTAVNFVNGVLDLDTPAIVRVSHRIDPDDLRHWNDEWLDPYWELELAQPHPQLSNLVKKHSIWTYGISYNLNGKIDSRTNLQPLPKKQQVITAIKNLFRRYSR
jgi:hypothetical protein